MASGGEHGKLGDADRKFVEQLYDQHARGLWRYVRSVVGSDAAADDLVSYAYVQVMRDIGKTRQMTPEHITGWLWLTAKRESWKAAKAQQRIAPLNTRRMLPTTGTAETTSAWW